jgi:hypothetical protein
MDILTELQKTHPGLYRLRAEKRRWLHRDTGNEHFLVFDGPDESLMAV